MFGKTTKTLIAALVLAGTAVAFVTDASAAPARGPNPEEINWMNRPSGPDTGGTNGM